MRVAAALAVLAAGAADAHPDASPPAHTGAFGEPSCTACHFDAEATPAAGTVRISGIPERFAPGASYDAVIEVTDGDARSFGFQLTVRDASGRQAGALAAAGTDTVVTVAGDVQYLGHAGAGGPRWSFRWTAPAADTSTVVFHVAVNAANGDRSEFGDRILLHEALTHMENRR